MAKAKGKGKRKTAAARAVASSKGGITRRMVLVATGAFATGAAVIAGSAYKGWWDHPPGKGLSALSRDEYDVIQSLAEAWMPPSDEEPSLSGAEADCGAFVDEVVSRMSGEQRKLFKLMLQIMDDTPWPIEFERFTRLPLESRARHLKVWLASPIFLHQQGVSAVMALISMAYTSHPEVAPLFARWFGCGYGR